MKQAIFVAYISCLLLSGITAVIYVRHLTRWKLSIMAVYLPLLFIMEVYLSWCLDHWPGKSNDFVYNLYKPVSLVVFAAMYYSVPIVARFRKMIVWIMSVYLVLNAVAYSFMIPIQESNTSLTLARGMSITFFAVFFLIGFLSLDDVEEQKFWQPLNWVTTGILLFYPVSSISTGFYPQLRDSAATLFGMKLYQIIPQLMSIFMYSCFTYAFYLCKRKS